MVLAQVGAMFQNGELLDALEAAGARGRDSLWRRARRQRELPAPEVIAEAKSRVGWDKLQLDPRARTAKLLVPNMRRLQ